MTDAATAGSVGGVVAFEPADLIDAAARLEPFGDRVIVRALREEGERRVGLIIIPDISDEHTTLGEVIACGPGRVLDSGECRPVPLVPGDVVMHGKFAGVTMEFEGAEVIFLREPDIMARVR
jgi:chaperonin GroES